MYYIPMDGRKKQINELERYKKEQIILLDTLLTRIGETFFIRTKNLAKKDAASFEEFDVYKRFQNDIAESKTAMQAVEEQIQRFKELEEGIEAKEQEESACLKELAVLYSSLGKLLLAIPPAENDSLSAGSADFCAPYRNQAEALQTKILSLEDRLDELEQKEGGNVFTWIGKNAQALVFRSFLTKSLDSLEQLRRTVGERYCRRDSLPDEDDQGYATEEIQHICAEIEQKRAELRVFTEDAGHLKEEKRAISGSFNAEGGPLRQIQNLKNHIAQVQDELKTLYKRMGAEAAAINIDNGADQRNKAASTTRSSPLRRKLFNSLVKPEDKEALEKAAEINRSIHEAQTSIEKLKASLAIDEEVAKIEKLRKLIQDRKDKIVQAEKNIAEFEGSIRDSEAHIKKLQKLL